ncbi:GntR family transcriptional regulator [Psychrobacillus sp. Sa2BUA9]|uniref:GntR family transcriptional regulator n=1 Tax=Psychrobacillus faecigallinarum TaxID=2762235 RepID=A0ABR8RB26_9BACI|nr:GntR family transcriptional regulator [Psychrobacillus faecigallinarum]MBD7944996.1 GntR family transcriptional regulator [Psychrobacillus faecigallinarum]
MIDFLPDKPIYQQIMEKIFGDLLKGNVKPGDRLPSVREYALEFGVNANTMQRVYKELELLHLTETKRGQGTFVTEDMQRLEELREEMKQTLVTTFLNQMESFGFTEEEIIVQLSSRKRGELN